MINIRLTDDMNPRNAARVIEHLKGADLYDQNIKDYGSRHDEWIEKLEARLVNGTTRALLATLGRIAAGVVVFRPEPNNLETIGIRHISVGPEYRGRHIGSFILRNAEFTACDSYPEASRMIADTKTTNHAMVAFLKSQQYTFEETVDLYDSGKPDMVFVKII